MLKKLTQALTASSAWGIAIFALVPLFAIGLMAFDSQEGLQDGLWNSRIAELSWNTLALLAATLLIAIPLGLMNAWCLARYQLRFKGLFMALALLPLALPGIVLATVWLTINEPTAVPSFLAWLLIPEALHSGLWAAALIMALGCYPYITLLVYSALQRIPKNVERSMRMLGASAGQRLIQVFVPALLPSVLGGAILVALHVIADFGVVALMRYRTFAWAVYQRLDQNFDLAAAAALSLLPMVVSVLLVLWQQRLSQKMSMKASQTQALVTPLNGVRAVLTYALLTMMALVAIGLPISVLIAGAITTAAERPWILAGNSIVTAALAALLTLIFGLVMAHFQWQHSGRLQGKMYTGLSSIASSGFAVPGPVFALGILIAMVASFGGASINQFGMALLIIGLALRMLPLALQSLQTGFTSLPKNTLLNTRLMGLGAMQRFWHVGLPWLSPAMLTALVMVFVETVKELPMTLLLRPIGFDTLAVRIWIDASEEMLAQASAASLALVVLSFPSIWLLYRGTQRNSQSL